MLSEECRRPVAIPVVLFGKFRRRSLPSEDEDAFKTVLKGVNLQNPKQFHHDDETWLDEIGGEPLAGSGFEAENPELDFQSTEPANAEPQDSREA